MVALLVVCLLVMCNILAYGAPVNVASPDDLPFNEDSRLSTHALLYYGGSRCDTKFSSMDLSFREVFKATKPMIDNYFKDVVKDGTCQIVCLERGQMKEHIYHPLPTQVTSLEAFSDIAGWVDKNCQAAEVGFISYLDSDAEVFWVSNTGERLSSGQLPPGERNTLWLQSYLGHRFEIERVDNKQVVDRITVEFNGIHHTGDYQSHANDPDRDVSDVVMSTFEAEWQRAHKVKRTFTEFGFSKGKLPIDLFASMSAYYYNNANQATIEEWNNKGVFVNWWEKDVFFVSMPFKLKKYWQSRLKALVEAWVGVPLELTDIYGMRRYEDGARLLTHVDREATHATSLIVNIAQGAIRKPWKVEIYDFADRLHEVEMNPGDIVYYESARCLHGRMQPLEGAYYVNLFAHYRPAGGDSLWYTKSNPAENAAQALDLGKCKSDGVTATCDGNFEVPYLSPKLEQLKGPRDLYDFWQKTGQKHKSHSPKEEL